MIEKDPSSVRTYYVNWTEWLAGDTIATSTWVVPEGLTKANDTNNDTHAYVKVSGGVIGTYYKLVNHIITAAGEQEDKTILIYIKER